MSVGVGFLLDEDNALKAHMKGLTVTDQNATRPVSVWFRLPEGEERPITYPFISIDLVDIGEEKNRAHRGRITPGYTPAGVAAAPTGSDNRTEFPIPVVLTYTVTTHTRSGWHDRLLQAQIIGGKLPLRFGAIEVPTGVSGETTVRRLDLLDVQQQDGLDANGKREFRKIYVVEMDSELYPDAIVAVKQVTQITLIPKYQLDPFIVNYP